jgi:hypothetical protein
VTVTRTAPLRLPRNGSVATTGARARPSHSRSIVDTTRLVDLMIVGMMLLAVIATFMLSGGVLTNLKIHYLTPGGNFLEKLHPTTFATVAATLLLLMRNGDPIGEINRSFSEVRLLLVHLFCWACLLIQMFVLDRPFTVIIDTFLLPILVFLVIWHLTPEQRRPLVWAVHATLLINIVLGYYEYFSGHRLIPLTLGSVLVIGEWRSAALLGHPLTASGIVAAYVMALVLRPAVCPPILLRLFLIAFSLGSLMAFGGRTALMTVLLVLGCLGMIEIIRLIRGKRIPLFDICRGWPRLCCVLARHLRQDAAALLVRQRQRTGALRDFRHVVAFRLERTDPGAKPNARERAAIAARTELRDREFLDLLHCPIWPRAYHPDHSGSHLLPDRAVATLRPGGLCGPAAHPHDRREFRELFIEKHPAGAIRLSHRAVAAQDASVRSLRTATSNLPSQPHHDARRP